MMSDSVVFIAGMFIGVLVVSALVVILDWLGED
jgi:hypothetical protein